VRRSLRAGLLAGLACASAYAADDYALKPDDLGNGVYVFVGRTDQFSRGNGGNIVNSGFIVGPEGTIVIDTGPSRLYGEQQRAAILRLTSRKVVQVYITHAHPDHFLGSQAYPADLIAALPATIASIRSNGEALSDNLYRLVGGWMKGTQVVVPGAEAAPGTVTIGARKLRLIAAAGHTDGDLMVYDEATKALFAGDLVFFQRAPTTPNADLPRWLGALDEIDRLDFKVLIPGHGPVQHNHAGIAQTRDYLRWLSTTLHDAANRGLDMPEVMNLPLPQRFNNLAGAGAEYTRSVVHLYPQIELESLPRVGERP
jgi:quinoprotein relay system zinc metallohydrolase 1